MRGRVERLDSLTTVFDMLYGFSDDVAQVSGVKPPAGAVQQYPYGKPDTEASLSQVLTAYQALS